MDTLQEQRNLIEQLVKSNNKFSGNEDLLEDFCSEAYKRSYSLFESLDGAHLQSYLAKVVNTSVLTVLKQSGRIRRRSNSYISTNELTISPVPAPVSKETSPVVSSSVSSNTVFGPQIYDIEDPKASFEEKIVRRDLLQKVVDIVLVAQKNSPQKEYLKIFFLRYMKEMKQKEIAKALNLSQSEVSKRLMEIADVVKAHFSS